MSTSEINKPLSEDPEWFEAILPLILIYLVGGVVGVVVNLFGAAVFGWNLDLMWSYIMGGASLGMLLTLAFPVIEKYVDLDEVKSDGENESCE